MPPDRAIPDSVVPHAIAPAFQHAIDTYASETNKTAAVWSQFADADLAWRPHPRSSTVTDILKHQLLSERRFFGEFLGLPEPSVAEILPSHPGVQAFTERLLALATPRLSFLAAQSQVWWLAVVPFFDVERERAWIFWRRVLHSAHHRTQLTVYLRLLDRPVPSVYGPTADVTWKGADPTNTTDAAGRK
ncbi:MAG TPA: DinB family protein [Bryobacteraceae bacterium]|nr:DinB family protein [Bryobacteraceae bacterium]